MFEFEALMQQGAHLIVPLSAVRYHTLLQYVESFAAQDGAAALFVLKGRFLLVIAIAAG